VAHSLTVPRAGTPAPGGAHRRAAGDLLERARRGAGGVLLVEGEPGAGKSLLLRESVDEAASYGFSLTVDCADQLGQAVPFFALRRALGEPFARGIAGLPDGERQAAPAWWIGQVRAHLEQRAAASPVLVCLDDLQWASAATLAALRTLPLELKPYPVAWVLARSTILRPDAERLFGLLEGDGATRLRLAPLTEQAVAALVADAFGAPPDPGLSSLTAQAGGNPRLLCELVGGLRDEGAVQVTDGVATLTSQRLPVRVHRAARRRLDGVSGRARQVLTTAAVLGGSFRLEDIAEMLGETPAVLLPAVEEMTAAGITAAGDTDFSFRHQLLRRAADAMVPLPGRRALHRQYARILLGRGEPAALAAGHLLLATDPGSPASVADLAAAAEQALRQAPQAAADLARRALELTPPGDRDALPRAVTAAEALAAAGRLAAADRVAREALAKPLPPAAEARLRCVLAFARWARGEASAAAAGDADPAAAARAVLELPDLPPDVRDDALAACLQALAGTPEEAAAGSLARTVLNRPGEYGPQVTAAALVALAVTSLDRGQARDALRLLRDAARQQTALSPDARHAQPLLALAAALVDLRRLDDAETILGAADSPALRAIPAQAAASILRARIELAKGRLADAEAAASRALAIAESLGAGGHGSAARCVLAVITLRSGSVMAAAQHLAGGVVPGPHAGEVYARAEAATAQAQVGEACDGPTPAAGDARDARGDLGQHPGRLLGDPATAAWLARTARAAGDPELAAEVARAAEALAAASPGFPAVTAAAAHSLGLASGDPARLAEAAETHPDPWARASAAEDLGLLHAQRQDHDLAVRHLTRAVQGYLEVGAVADVARTRRRLRRLGVRHRAWARPALRPATGWESLTNAERAASELVAQGLNNRQVAGRMYVSEHTVAFYLRQAFRKLDIRSRVQLARIVIERRPAADEAGLPAS
jgi:DNA-binding CsgD family transcriptional regulator